MLEKKEEKYTLSP